MSEPGVGHTPADARDAVSGRLLELVVLCGLQASGKSTYQRRHLPEHVVVSKDLLRNNRRRDARQRELIRAALADGRSVVVDNTNPSFDERRVLLELAEAIGARTIVYFFDVPYATAAARNRERTGRDRVPDVGLASTSARLDVPSASEGFDERWVVRSVDGGEFDVTPMSDWEATT